jgi:hypothetical protein
MSEFFRGWRRKTGVLMFVVACMLIVEWAKTRVNADYVTYEMQRGGTVIKSSGGRLSVSAIILGEFEKYPIWRWTSAPPTAEILRQLGRRSVEISYAALVIPMTLFSAYLLLSKPRPRKPTEATKPPDEAQ